jgi:hypothetical protein
VTHDTLPTTDGRPLPHGNLGGLYTQPTALLTFPGRR